MDLPLVNVLFAHSEVSGLLMDGSVVQVADLPKRPTAVCDVAGNGEVQQAIYTRLGDDVVGAAPAGCHTHTHIHTHAHDHAREHTCTLLHTVRTRTGALKRSPHFFLAEL